MRTTTTPPVKVTPRTLAIYTVIATALATAVLAGPMVIDLPAEIFLLIAEYVVLLGGAILIAGRSGTGGVRRLFSGIAHWRIGWFNWALAVLAMPTLTIGIAIAAGAYSAPADGWGNVAVDFLFRTFIFGAIGINLAEETAWQGMVQRNLTRRLGLLRASAITAIPFALVHVPLSYAAGSTLSESLFLVAVSTAVAPLMRYVVGRTDLATGGSLLAAGVFHASFNASGQLTVVATWWLYAVALGVIAVGLLAVDAVRARRNAAPLYAQEAAPVWSAEVLTSA